MANIYGFDAFGTDLYTQQGNLFIPREGFVASNPREIINFSANLRTEGILRQYVKLNAEGLYEVNIPGKPKTVFYNEADALKNCRYQLTNTPSVPANIPTNAPAVNPTSVSTAPQNLGNGYVAKFNAETGKYELTKNGKIIGREYHSMDEINRLVNAGRGTTDRKSVV